MIRWVLPPSQVIGTLPRKCLRSIRNAGVSIGCHHPCTKPQRRRWTVTEVLTHNMLAHTNVIPLNKIAYDCPASSSWHDFLGLKCRDGGVGQSQVHLLGPVP